MSASFRSTTPYTALPYPPSGVGGEAEASVGVELLNSLHKPYVALTDEVFEEKLIAAISFATDTTRRRFFSMSFYLAFWSPGRAFWERITSWRSVRRQSLPIFAK
jgi:hypothetical protein